MNNHDQSILNNSLKIHEENTKKITAVSVVLYVIKFHVNLHKHFISFDFLSLDSVDFENYFANKLINMGRYVNHTCSRALSDIKCSACASHFISDKALLRVL